MSIFTGVGYIGMRAKEIEEMDKLPYEKARRTGDCNRCKRNTTQILVANKWRCCCGLPVESNVQSSEKVSDSIVVALKEKMQSIEQQV